MGGVRGPATDIDIEAREIIKMRERINHIIARETGQTYRESGRGHRSQLLDGRRRGDQIRDVRPDRAVAQGVGGRLTARRRATSWQAAMAGLTGASLRRLEDARFLTGRGRYVDDIVEPGRLHAARRALAACACRGDRGRSSQRRAGAAGVLGASPPPIWQSSGRSRARSTVPTRGRCGCRPGIALASDAGAPCGRAGGVRGGRERGQARDAAELVDGRL